MRVYTNKIEAIDASGKVVAEHGKVGHGEWSIKLEHYLHTLRYKPGALKNAEALRQAPEGIRKVFRGAFADNPKDFVELLIFAKERDIVYDGIVEAFNSLKESHVHNITLQLMEDELQPGNTQKTISWTASNRTEKPSRRTPRMACVPSHNSWTTRKLDRLCNRKIRSR